MWTRFWDMHSGGDQKMPPVQMVFIQAPEEEAKSIFEDRFGRDPENVTCQCCGMDYSIYEWPTLEGITAFYRGCKYDYIAMEFVEEHCGKDYNPYLTLEEYCQQEEVLVIREDELPSHRVGRTVTESVR